MEANQLTPILAVFGAVVSVVSLGVSFTTAWLTWFHQGTIKMTHPALVFFGPDDRGYAKVFVRTLLHSTSRRGQLVEHMFARLRQGDKVQAFKAWFHNEGDGSGPGSGLYVGYEGFAADHHFALLQDALNFQFSAGTYSIEVYAKLMKRKEPILLWTHEVTLDEREKLALAGGQGGLIFNWDPDRKSYQHDLNRRPRPGKKSS